MEHNEQTEPLVVARKPYEAPHLQVVELLPEETLGIGCKTASEIPCQTGPTIGS